ncbi:MAG: DUF3515 domain-containing protein [Nocardioides sp.]
MLLAGCSEPVVVDSPELDETAAEACQAFLDDLPTTLSGEDPVEITPGDALGAAYGDPAIVVRCVADAPGEFDKFASCEVANGVGWFVPRDQIEDQELDAVLTAVTYQPLVEVMVPVDYRPEGVAAVLAELAAPVQANLEFVQDCV